MLDRYKVRYYVNKGLATFNDSLRHAGHVGLMCQDPSGELRKVYPLPFIFAMDLGEQYTVAGVMAKHCAAWEVPRAKYADLRAARDPGYPCRTVEGMRDARRAMRQMSSANRTKEASRVGVFPLLKVKLTAGRIVGRLLYSNYDRKVELRRHRIVEVGRRLEAR